jgi:hypothetical protein
MIKNDLIVVWIVTAWLVIYCILMQFPSTVDFAIAMWMISPFMVVWMVYSVLRFGSYKGPELGEKEFGYQR